MFGMTAMDWLAALAPGLIIALGFAVYIAVDECKQRGKRKRWAEEYEEFWAQLDREMALRREIAANREYLIEYLETINYIFGSAHAFRDIDGDEELNR